MTLFAILPKPEFDMDLAEKDETKERLKEKHAELGKHNNCCDNLRQFSGQKVVTCSITAKYFVEISILTPSGNLFVVLTYTYE